MSNRVLSLIALALCWVCASAQPGNPPAPPAARAATVELSAALSAEADTPEFPSGAALRTVHLPDDWPQSRPGATGPVWYRLNFQGPAAGTGAEPLAAMLSRVCTTYTAHLNGRLLHVAGRQVSPTTNNCNHPQLLQLPASLLLPGTNTLDIRVSGLPAERVAAREHAGGLSAVSIGGLERLSSEHARLLNLQVGTAVAASLTLSVLGLQLFVMGWFNRRNSHLAYFGGLCLAWALSGVHAWLQDLPLDDAAVEFLIASLLPMITLTTVQFLLRRIGRRHRLADVVLPLQCVLMPLSLMLVGPSNLQAATQAWTVLLTVEVLAAAAQHLTQRWQSSRLTFWVTTAFLLLAFLSRALDGLGLTQGLDPWSRLAVASVVPLLLLVVGLRLIQQHGSAQETAEANRNLLERRVAEAKAEIESNYRQLSELRVVQVTDRERKRIAADLHDDLGAKLLTIVHTSESERISTLAREALEEMRLSVRGLTGKPVRLEDALGDWRAEVISRLGQAGIEAVWNMPADDLPQTLSARAFVQTTRIIREAVNNIIKHSGASQCAVRCNVADGDFQLVIQDNGKGIVMEFDGRLDRGHGLSSMKGRAKQLQGQCLVESGPGYGTVIRLTIPLEPATTPA